MTWKQFSSESKILFIFSFRELVLTTNYCKIQGCLRYCIILTILNNPVQQENSWWKNILPIIMQSNLESRRAKHANELPRMYRVHVHISK